MAMHVCNGATIKCVFAVPPGVSTLIVLPQNRVMTSNQPAANIMDNKPMVNIPTFGMCMSPSNPTFVSATSAAMGVPTPVPCVPATPAPWAPGAPTVLVGNMPALNSTSLLGCALGTPGCISILMPGQFTEQVP